MYLLIKYIPNVFQTKMFSNELRADHTPRKADYVTEIEEETVRELTSLVTNLFYSSGTSSHNVFRIAYCE